MSPRQTARTSSESRIGEAQLNAWNSDCPREYYGDSCWSDLPCLFCTFHHISLANQCALQCLCRLCNANELFVAPNVSKALWLPWLRALLQAQFELAPATPLHLGVWDYNKAHDIPQHHVPGLTDPNADYLAGSHFSNSIVIHHRKKGRINPVLVLCCLFLWQPHQISHLALGGCMGANLSSAAGPPGANFTSACANTTRSKELNCKLIPQCVCNARYILYIYYIYIIYIYPYRSLAPSMARIHACAQNTHTFDDF